MIIVNPHQEEESVSGMTCITITVSEYGSSTFSFHNGTRFTQITIPSEATQVWCITNGTLSFVSGNELYNAQLGESCSPSAPCAVLEPEQFWSNKLQSSGYNSSSAACPGATSRWAIWSSDVQDLDNETTTSILGKRFYSNSDLTSPWDGQHGYYNYNAWYNLSETYEGVQPMAVKIDANGYVVDASACFGLVTPTPTPPTYTPTPTPTPTPTTTSTIYRYVMNPCDGVSANIVAASYTTKSIGAVYELTGSTWSNQKWTAISTSTSSYETWIGDLSICDEGGGGGCVVAGTKIEMHDGTLKNVEDVNEGDALMSRIVDGMPDSDNEGTLENWSAINPNTGSELTQVTSRFVFWTTEVYNFNSGLLQTTFDHLHYIKRGELSMIRSADQVKVGDSFIDKNGDEIKITSIVPTQGTFQVFKLSVEEADLYLANGIITHNDKPVPRGL